MAGEEYTDLFLGDYIGMTSHYNVIVNSTLHFEPHVHGFQAVLVTVFTVPFFVTVHVDSLHHVIVPIFLIQFLLLFMCSHFIM